MAISNQKSFVIVEEYNLRLKNLRKRYHYSKTFIANYLKISRLTYSRYEDYINDVPVDIIVKLCKLYNVSVDYMLRLTNKITT